MPIYIAMLRGINVGPHKRMKMDKLRATCEALGFTQVQTYIQSGNVVFRAQKVNPNALAETMENRIRGNFGFSVDVIVRTRDELQQIINSNPYRNSRGVDQSRLHVVFLSQLPSAEAIHKLESLTLAPDKIRPAGKEIYFYFPNGVSGSSLWKHPTDRILAVPSTMRNWNTVNALYEMAVACG